MIVVTNSLAGRMNMTAEQIYRRSVKNLLPSCVIIPFNEMLGEIGLLPPEEITENIPCPTKRDPTAPLRSCAGT